MRICTDNNGKLIEMQSHATAGTLVKNAVNAGYLEEEVEEREVTEAEWAEVLAAQPKPPVKKTPIETLTDALIAKGAITAADLKVK